MLRGGGFTRDDLAAFEFNGNTYRLVGPQTGIWKVKDVSDAAISIVTSYVPPGAPRPYEDSVGADGMLRYKWRGPRGENDRARSCVCPDPQPQQPDRPVGTRTAGSTFLNRTVNTRDHSPIAAL